MREAVPIFGVVRPRTGDRLAAKLRAEGGCWVFMGTRNARGYGFVEVMISGVRFSILAHRLAWVLANGMDVPSDRIICHRCNNPSCCNPKHLYLGTHQTNHDDMVRAGRQRKGKPLLGRKGEKHPRSKYSDQQRLQAIELRRGAMPFRQIALIVGCKAETASRWWNDEIRKAV